LDLLRTGFIDYASYERQVEAVLVHGDTAIVMGSETLTRKTAWEHLHVASGARLARW